MDKIIVLLLFLCISMGAQQMSGPAPLAPVPGVIGPLSSTNLNLACFSGTNGGTLSDCGVPSTFVNSLQTFAGGCTAASACTVNAVLTNSACSASYLGNYAVVSNLYSGAASTNEVMRCGLSGSSYYWRPIRTDYVSSVSTTGGSIGVSCFVNAPVMFITGTLTSNSTISLSATNCWPGASFNIANNATLGISTLTVAGLVGATTKLLGLNARGTFFFDGTNWQAF